MGGVAQERPSRRTGTASPLRRGLVDRPAVNGLAVDSCTTAQLGLARELRESIHLAATAGALQDAIPASAVQVINDRGVEGRAAVILTPEGTPRWRIGSASRVEDAATGRDAADLRSYIRCRRSSDSGSLRDRFTWPARL
ncbi:ABATE domain-containing protein [Spirillospora sp. CA-108201]